MDKIKHPDNNNMMMAVLRITEIEAGTVLVFDLPLARSGKYHFYIAVDDNITTTVPLTVVQAPTAPAPNTSQN